jgi:hypothetical protein
MRNFYLKYKTTWESHEVLSTSCRFVNEILGDEKGGVYLSKVKVNQFFW